MGVLRSVSVAVAAACIAGAAGADHVRFDRDGRRGDHRAFERSGDRSYRSHGSERADFARSTRSKRWGERWGDRWGGLEPAHRARGERDAGSIDRARTMRDVVGAVIQRLADDAHASARRPGEPGPSVNVVVRIEIEDQHRRDRLTVIGQSSRTPVLNLPGKGPGKNGAGPNGSGNSHVHLALAHPSAAGPVNRGGSPVVPLGPGNAGSSGAGSGQGGQSGGFGGGPSAGGGAVPLGPGGPGSSPAAVPLPTSAGLGLAAMGVLGMRRRR